jgi:hypothetical protein
MPDFLLGLLCLAAASSSACKGDRRDAAMDASVAANGELGTGFAAAVDAGVSHLGRPVPINSVEVSSGPRAPLEGVAEAGTTAPGIASALAGLDRRARGPSADQGPSVEWGPPRVTGGLLTDIEPALRRMRAGIRACYERFLEGQEEGDTTATLSLRIVVLPNGSVRKAGAAEARGLDPSTVDCIVRRAEMTTFPPPISEAAEVTLPIILRSRSGVEAPP